MNARLTAVRLDSPGAAAITDPIYAAEKWNETGLRLFPSLRYRFEIHEIDGLADASIQLKDLEGWQRWWATPLALFRRRACEPWFALIGTINREDPFRIGNGSVCDPPHQEGSLVCYFNDLSIAYGNNHGHVRLKVTAVAPGAGV